MKYLYKYIEFVKTGIHHRNSTIGIYINQDTEDFKLSVKNFLRSNNISLKQAIALTVLEKAKSEKRKTYIYECFNISENERIGFVKWYPAFRQYCFYPEENTIFAQSCLEDIIDFIDQVHDERVK